MSARVKIKQALNDYPIGLTIEDVAQICGIEYNTAYLGLLKMFHHQEVVKVVYEEKTVYRLQEIEIVILNEIEGRGRNR